MQWTQRYLGEHGVDEPRLATEVLLSQALGCAKIELYTRFDSIPQADQLTAFREWVQAAAEHTPVAYLVGCKEFFSLEFEVTPAVLIPRPETEALVARALFLCENGILDRVHFLDVGTGSGCIAVTILKHAPDAQAVATDVSAEALEVARRNAEAHGVAERITFAQADRLKLAPELVPEGGFELMVSNPPYISAEEMAALPETVAAYEPPRALDGGEDGLSFYRTFAEAGPGILRAGGSILVEIGYGKGPGVLEIFAHTDRFEHTGTWRDSGDPHDRVMGFRLKTDDRQ